MVGIERTDEPERLRTTLARIAPGTPLRDGLERILRGRTGALLVLGNDDVVQSIASGGFSLDVPFTATGLRELAKMDGAIVLDADATVIHRAAVHLMPDQTIPSEETGHPAPHRRPRRPPDRLPGRLGVAVDADHRGLRRRDPLRAGGLQPDPLPRQPGAGHPRALQAAPRRGRQQPVGARGRGPRHRPRRGRGRPAPRDGHPIAREIEGYVLELGTDGAAAVAAARGAHHRRRPRARAGDPRLPAGPSYDQRGRRPRPPRAADPRPTWSTSRPWPGRSASPAGSTSTVRSPPAATGCWPRSPASPRWSSTAWSTTSARSRSSSPRPRRPPGRRRRRRAARTLGARGPVPPRRVEHPRPVRLSHHSARDGVATAGRDLGAPPLPESSPPPRSGSRARDLAPTRRVRAGPRRLGRVRRDLAPTRLRRRRPGAGCRARRARRRAGRG